MVHVGVGEEDEVDGGEVGDTDAGAALATQDDQAGGEDGVDEDVFAGELEEEGGVADEGDAELRGEDAGDGVGVAGEGLGVALADELDELLELLDGEGAMLPEAAANGGAGGARGGGGTNWAHA